MESLVVILLFFSNYETKFHIWLIFQLADEIGLDLNPVSYLSMAGWDEETGEQFTPMELLNTVFDFASVNIQALLRCSSIFWKFCCFSPSFCNKLNKEWEASRSGLNRNQSHYVSIQLNRHAVHMVTKITPLLCDPLLISPWSCNYTPALANRQLPVTCTI